ncbi:hypothetical protein ACWDSD_38720, partial [Streptomyces spiralis]
RADEVSYAPVLETLVVKATGRPASPTSAGAAAATVLTGIGWSGLSPSAVECREAVPEFR